jgi:hypothetical protein
MLFALAAGAIADSYDKRAVVLAAQVFTTWARSCWQDAAILA